MKTWYFRVLGRLLLHTVTPGEILKLTGAFMREIGDSLCQGKDEGRQGERAVEAEEKDVPR